MFYRPVVAQSQVVLLQQACGAADPRQRYFRRQCDHTQLLLYIVQETISADDEQVQYVAGARPRRRYLGT